jgi:hypothetical protein
MVQASRDRKDTCATLHFAAAHRESYRAYLRSLSNALNATDIEGVDLEPTAGYFNIGPANS